LKYRSKETNTTIRLEFIIII